MNINIVGRKTLIGMGLLLLGIGLFGVEGYIQIIFIGIVLGISLLVHALSFYSEEPKLEYSQPLPPIRKTISEPEYVPPPSRMYSIPEEGQEEIKPQTKDESIKEIQADIAAMEREIEEYKKKRKLEIKPKEEEIINEKEPEPDDNIIKENVISCPVCGKVFKNNRMRWTHLSTKEPKHEEWRRKMGVE